MTTNDNNQWNTIEWMNEEEKNQRNEKRKKRINQIVSFVNAKWSAYFWIVRENRLILEGHITVSIRLCFMSNKVLSKKKREIESYLIYLYVIQFLIGITADLSHQWIHLLSVAHFDLFNVISFKWQRTYISCEFFYLLLLLCNFVIL